MCQEPRPFGAFAPLQGETKGRRDCKLEYERPYDSHDDVQLPYEVPARSRDSTEPPVTPGGASTRAWRRLGVNESSLSRPIRTGLAHVRPASFRMWRETLWTSHMENEMSVQYKHQSGQSAVVAIDKAPWGTFMLRWWNSAIRSWQR